MKKNNQRIIMVCVGLLLLLVVTACTGQQNQNEANDIPEMMMEDMAGMPCHRMPDGSLMGACSEEELANNKVNGE